MNRSLITRPFNWPQPLPKSMWRSVKERWPWSNHLFIDYPDLKAVVEDGWRSLEHVLRNGRSIAMLVIGETGCGKTRLADEFIAHTKAVFGRDDSERTIMPALKLEIPDGCTPRGFCVAILHALGDPMAEKRKVNLTPAVAALLRSCEVRVIVIDNVQDIPTRRRARGIEQVGIRLRELIDQTQCLWLLLGTRSAAEVVDSESQLIKRVAYRKTLPYFSIESDKSAKRFLKLLVRFDEWLPLAEHNIELLRQLAGRIAIATEGVLDRVEKLLDGACLEAVSQDREHLIADDFLSGFRTLYGPDVPNPFADGFALRRLRGVNEPFEKLAAPPAHASDGKMARHAGGRRTSSGTA